MDYFNFFYKLSMIFSNKKRLKIFIVIGLIFLFIFACTHGVFASSDDNYIMNYQLNMQRQFIAYLRYWYTNKDSNYNSNTFNAICGRLTWSNIYVVTPTGDPNSEMWVYVYTPNQQYFDNSPQNFTIDGTWSIGLNSGTQYDVKLGEFTSKAFIKVSAGGSPLSFEYSSSTSSFYMPSATYMVRSVEIDNFLIDFGYSKSPSLSNTFNTNDDELQSIASSGFSTINSTIQNQTSQMTNSINDASTSISNSVDNLNNTITDTTTDDSQVELAQDNNQDLTNGFFTSLYNTIEDAFTDTSYKYVNFPIPFTNKNITFSSSYVLNNIKRNSKFSVLVSLAESVWWFGLGYFVLLDIYKKINAIKSGDLTNIENENITTNLL